MRHSDLLGGYWWDESETIRLYHGTSSEFLTHIQEHGLLPPQKELLEYALEILEHYIPRDQWTDELVKDISNRAARIPFERGGKHGRAIFCFTEKDDVAGYASSYAQHGGEIAYDVYMIACQFLSPPDISLKDFKANLPLSPRFANAKPIAVGIEVPKSWYETKFDLDLLRKNIDKKHPPEEREANYRRWIKSREFLIDRDVPPEMIFDISILEPQSK